MKRTLKRGVSLAAVMVGLGAGSASAYYNTSTAVYDASPAPALLSTVSGCDDCSEVVNLPFAFPFYGNTFTQLTVSSNGYLVLGNTTATAYSNPQLTWSGSTVAPAGTIAPLWDDWNTAAGGEVYAGMVGSAYVVEWRNISHFGQSAAGGYTFKVKLFSDGAFEFHYGTVTGGSGVGVDNGGSATVGFQEGQNTVAHPVSFNQATVSSSTARRFTRPGNVGLYINIRDGLFGQPRSGLLYTLDYLCGGSNTSISTISTTTNDGWSRTVSTCSQSLALRGTRFGGDVSGYSVSTYPLAGGESVVTSGTYMYLKRSDVTPRQARQSAFTVTYAGTTSYRAVLDYWQNGALDKPLLIVTGFDPLNEDTTANYLVLMGDLVRTLQNEGFDIIIGKHGDGNQRLGWYRGEVAAWVDDIVARMPVGSKIQVAGISQGGIVLRDTLHSNANSIQSKVKAWYSIDSPQLGANLGRASRGVQTLLLCHQPESHPGRRKLTSLPTYDLAFSVATTCSCDNEPENSTCGTTTIHHDQYYGVIGWPSTAIPRYALAFGDANPNGGFNKLGTAANLYDFTYTGWFCSEDRDWEPGQRDCVAGSRSITAADVNTEQGTDVCGNFRLGLQFEPAFINADSALAVTSNALNPEAASSSCPVNYGSLAPTQWNDWASNDHNEKHEVLTSALANELLSWVRLHQ